MRDYSLDNNAEKIYSPKTKEYFKEVLVSYYTGNYRSSVVMLYSVVIADIIYKLEDLRDLYEDDIAVEILDEIKRRQNENERSPEWENYVVDTVKEKTELLEIADHMNIRNLKEMRHLCAHPVITQRYELYNPNKETTRAHIRNSLEGVLTKPPLLSRRIFNDFMIELSKIKRLKMDHNQLDAYLQSRFLKNISDKVEVMIFKSLWKIVLRITKDEKAVRNRKINLQVLLILLNRNYDSKKSAIQDDVDYYSEVDPSLYRELIVVLNSFNDIFYLLNEKVTIPLKRKIDEEEDLYSLVMFTEKDIITHINEVLDIEYGRHDHYDENNITADTIQLIYLMAKEKGKIEEGKKFLIEMFGHSNSYDTADDRFPRCIHENLTDFTLSDVIEIIIKINSNTQLYRRYNAAYSNNIIIHRFRRLGGEEGKLSEYVNFIKKI